MTEENINDSADIQLAKKLVEIRKEHGDIKFIGTTFMTEGGACGHMIYGKANTEEMVALTTAGARMNAEVAQSLEERVFESKPSKLVESSGA
jgi:hypothetical protein